MNVRNSPYEIIKNGTITRQGSYTGLHVENTILKEQTSGMSMHLRVIESDKVKLLWYFTIQCDNQIEHSMPDMVVVEKTGQKCIIIDITFPGDNRVGEKETEKIKKYQELEREIKNLWSVRNREAVPVVIGALGSVSQKFEQ